MLTKLVAFLKRFFYNRFNVKEIEMSRPKKIEEVQTEEVPKVEEKTLELNETSFGLAKDSKTGNWHLVKIKYNLEALIAGTPEKVGQGDMKAIGLEHLKIAIANELIK